MNRSRLMNSTALHFVRSAKWDRRSIVFWETYSDLRARGWDDARIQQHALTNNVRWDKGERERLGGAI